MRWNVLTDKNISGKVVDHLGLVAVTIEKIKLMEKIDARLPLKRAKTTMGERVVSMIYNGLGFIDDRLYMFPEFLENKPVDRLFERELKAEFFNDDVMKSLEHIVNNYFRYKSLEELEETEKEFEKNFKEDDDDDNIDADNFFDEN